LKKIFHITLRIIGGAIALFSWGFLWFYYWLNLLEWWGIIGTILSIVVAPGMFLFPIIFWIKTGSFPLGYFIMAFTGSFGLYMLLMIGSSDEDEDL